MLNTRNGWRWQVGRKFKKNGREYRISERWFGGANLDTCGISIIDISANIQYNNVSLDRIGDVETYL